MTKTATLKEELHELVDQLPQTEETAAHRYLKFLIAGQNDPLIKMLDEAPYDDEPVVEEESSLGAEALELFRRGETISSAQAKNELLS